jgi:glycine/D-amino acid oxidase-like deaminating enzyme
MTVLPNSPLSLWLDRYGDYSPQAPLAGDIEADVTVIGGGLTGLATAIHLRRRDQALRVAVLEAREVGYGASGRNGSFAMTVSGLGFGVTAMLRGKNFLRRTHTYMEQCVDELERFIDDDGLECEKIRPGFLRVATTPSYVKRLQKQVRLMASLGFDGIDWIDAETTRSMVNSERYLGAMWEPRLVLIDPARLVREEKRRAIELGASVFERSPALAVVRATEYGGAGPGFRILTSEGSITTGKVAFATNAYSHLLAPTAKMQAPVFTYMIATEPLTEEQLAPIGWAGMQGVEDARNLIHYYRLTPDHRIVLGGGPVGLTARNSLEGDSDESAWRYLEHHLRWLWPHLADATITHRWGGPFSVTVDLTPALGYLGGHHDAVYALGCMGHGVSMSYLNGLALTELLLGDTGGIASECPFVNRRLLPWPSEPVATLFKHATRDYLVAEDAVHEHLLARLTGRRQTISTASAAAAVPTPARSGAADGEVLTGALARDDRR